jgi:general secretion pathway protein K
VIIIVLVSVLFTVLALTAFIEKASTDLIIDTRDATNTRLRMEAYSALEATLAVLENFREADGALRSPVEGWTDPLTFASWVPSEGRTVDVAFEDESAKISLPRVDAPTLVNLFENWNMAQTDAERLTDALMGWMKKDYAGSGTYTPDYDTGTIPYEPPARSLRSFGELAAIDVARDMFYDENGRPNDYYNRFTDAVSLFNYQHPNINSAKSDVLIAVGNFDDDQQQHLSDFLNGVGNYFTQGPGYLRSIKQATGILGQANVAGFDVQIRALRIRITVHEGRNIFRLNTVIAPQGGGGAQTVQTSAPKSSSTAATDPSAANAAASAKAKQNANAGVNQGAGSNRTTTNTNAKIIKYPFTVLDIRENDEPLPAFGPPAVLPDSV